MMIGKLKETVRAWHAREKAIRELRGLDDRSLSDLGISRGDIKAVVKGSLPF